MANAIKNIFMSYSRDDKHWTYELAKSLHDELNYSVFVDYRNIYIGTNWWRTICENIESADCIIYVMTPKSTESMYCSTEIEYAITLNKPILPIMLKNCVFPQQLAEKQIQYLSLNDDMQLDKTLLQLQKGITELQRLLFSGEYTPINPLPNRPDEPKPNSTKSVEEVFEYAATLAYDGQLDQAELLFQKALEADKTGDMKNPIERWKKQIVLYKRIARFASNFATQRDAYNLWSDYLFEFDGEFDPFALEEKVKHFSKPSIKKEDTIISEKIIYTPSQKTIIPYTTSVEIMPSPFQWVDIPKGKVTVLAGGYLKKNAVFTIPAFQIAKYPITNAQFDIFINHPDGYQNPQWWNFSENAIQWRNKNTTIMDKFVPISEVVSSSSNKGKKILRDLYKLPRTNISWYEAVAFCNWLCAITGEKISLPSEQQWQRAGQGDALREYPFSSSIVYLNQHCNISGETFGEPTPVDKFMAVGDSIYKVSDMAGNVWEWCTTSYDIGENDLQGIENRVVRGGSWKCDEEKVKVTYRESINPIIRASDIGFRIVRLR